MVITAMEARKMTNEWTPTPMSKWDKFWLGREVNNNVRQQVSIGEDECSFATDHARAGALEWLQSLGYEVTIRNGSTYYFVDLSW
jgi:hypothetical protein